MQSNFKLIPIIAIAGLLTVCCLACATMSSAEEPECDQDFGTFWSFTCRFIYSGEGADTVIWDFGDETAPVEGFNVDHTFAAAGTYIVTQTSTNTIGSTVAKYRVEILGFPTVTYVSYGGNVTTVSQTAYNTVPVMIEDPARDGYTFDGWYTDEACTVPFDFSQKLTEPATVYAKWTAVSGSGTGSGDDPESDAGNDIAAWIGDHVVTAVAAGISAIFLIMFAIRRDPRMAILAVVCLAVAGLAFFEVIPWN